MLTLKVLATTLLLALTACGGGRDHESLRTQGRSIDVAPGASLEAKSTANGRSTADSATAAVYPVGTIVASGANRLRALKDTAVSPSLGTPAVDWELVEVREPTVVQVPSQYATIPQAFRAISVAEITGNGVLTIKVAAKAGGYALDKSLSLNHAFGSRLRLVGDESGKHINNVRLLFASSSDGLVVDDGHSFGLIQGFTIEGVRPGRRGQSANSQAGFDNAELGIKVGLKGVLVGTNSVIARIEQVTVKNFYYAVQASDASAVSLHNAQMFNGGDGNLFIYTNSTGICARCVSEDAANGGTLGMGMIAEIGAKLLVSDQSTIKNNDKNGLFANVRGILVVVDDAAPSSTAANSMGVFAHAASVVVTNNLTSDDNRDVGIAALNNSLIDAQRVAARHNLNAGMWSNGLSHIQAAGSYVTGRSDLQATNPNYIDYKAYKSATIEASNLRNPNALLGPVDANEVLPLTRPPTSNGTGIFQYR